MAQHDYVIANGTGAAVRSDLNNGLAAIVSNNSGATEPATMYAYQWWADTTTGLLKLRNAANNAWITVGTLASANLGLAALASPTFTGTVTAPTFTASTAVNIPLGSAGSPTLFFTGDTNNGLFSPGADIVALTTDGSERFRIAASGQIGLGGANYGTSGQALTSNGSGSAPTWQTPVSTSDKISEGNTEAEVVDTGSDGHFKVTTEGSERLRVDPSGRLLVGTSTASTATSAQYARIQIVGHTGATEAPGRLVLRRNETSSNISLNEQIGQIFFGDNEAGEYALIECASEGTAGSGDYPGRLVFSTTADGASSPTERMRINNLGALKATTTGSYAFPSLKMHELRSDNNDRSVYISNTNASPYGLYVKYDTDANGTGNEFLVCVGSSTERLQIRSNGGIANFSANNVNLSDINAKKDIAPAAGTWDCLKDWEIVNFRYKDQPDDADLNLGVIAQQVAESCPEVITVFQEAKEATEDQPAQEERLGVKDQQMMWMAIKALQEAQLRIETLEAKVASLEAQ